MVEDDIWDFVWDKFGDAWAKNANEVPRTIYHYTTASGLYGILESNSLRATNVGFLNDELELQHVSKFIDQAIDNLSERRGTRRHHLLMKVKAAFEKRLRDAADAVFVVSFSTKDDDLTQWRSYAGSEGGFAVGLSTADMRQLLRSSPRPPRPFRALLRPVLYDDTAIRDVVDGFISNCLKRFTIDVHGASTSKASALIRVWKEAIAARLVAFAPLAKHRQFESESECRIVATLRRSARPAAIKFVPKSTVLAAYVEVSKINDCIRKR